MSKVQQRWTGVPVQISYQIATKYLNTSNNMLSGNQEAVQKASEKTKYEPSPRSGDLLDV